MILVGLKKNFDGILISSDSIKILKIGKSYKFITIKRPKKFANKNSSSSLLLCMH